MIITYHSGECVRISAGDITLAFNPISKKSKLKSASFGSDVVFMSIDHPDMNGVESVTRKDTSPFIISGPGEYETHSIHVTGLLSKSNYGKERYNTMYYFLFDGLHVLFAGALDQAKAQKEILEDIEEVDVLFVPIGGDGVLTPAEAHAFAVSLEAKIIVPIHWDGIGASDALKKFLKEAGAEKAQQQEKLTLKPKDVVGLSGEVTVLKP